MYANKNEKKILGKKEKANPSQVPPKKQKPKNHTQ
jgi:hypothetical protein